ncbi:hypothetical protein LI951_03770 [Enterococcus sp. BWT-B8]|uniref:hypothetical protein n=1 Tax=unclassified Enterococcus TaxID=2608891 RepID=UPI001E44CA55|nr:MULTISPECIES: hypothetical protein [unclassified Enterococcus]MCB5951177.1 hypothetical protein [Enterococcus sp. BWT-B8]MCB5954879.1 hypothetical protein [Enterococcus sp. CWB-B31]
MAVRVNFLLINPYDNHYCEQISDELMDYRRIHAAPNIMQQLTKQVTGEKELLFFSQTAVSDYQGLGLLSELYSLINNAGDYLKKVEQPY